MAAIYIDTPVQIETVPPAAKLRVFRDSEEDIGYRECLIIIDGEEVGNVRHRRNLEIELEPGIHVIQACNRVRKTGKLSFSLKPGERITFQVANSGGAFYEFFAWMQVAIPKISLRREMPEEHMDVYLTELPECWNIL
jgi:hypothetical protein